MTYQLLHKEAPGFCALLIFLCFMTCNDMREPKYDFGPMPAFSVPFTQFDSLMTCAEYERDSTATAFDAMLLRVKKERVEKSKASTEIKTGHPFGKGYSGNR